MTSTPATTPPTSRPRRRPRFGALVAVVLVFRFGREVVERVALSSYGVLGVVAVFAAGLMLLALWRWDQRRRAAARGGEFTPAQVVAQVAQSGFDGPAFEEDGTLLGASLLVVNQLPKVIEVNTEYEVFDGRGERLGAVRQVLQSRAKQVVRFVLPVDQFLTHRFDITDADGGLVLQLLRPRKIFLTKLHVYDGAGTYLGTIRQRNVFWKIKFDIVNPLGSAIGHLRAENLRAWDFHVVDRAEQTVARLFKSWEGWARAAFTRADHFVVRIERPLDEPLRSLTVAAALAADLALKQDSRR